MVVVLVVVLLLLVLSLLWFDDDGYCLIINDGCIESIVGWLTV